MSCSDHIESQEINQLEGNLKRKADSDTIGIDNSLKISTKCNTEEDNSFDVTKKQCSWRPPLKNEIENAAAFTAERSICFPAFRTSHETSSDTITQEISIQKVNEESEQENEDSKLTNCPNYSNIYKINCTSNNSDSDKDENENISLGSMETLPTGLFYNNEEFDLKSTDEEKSISSRKESATVLANENILSDEENSCLAQSDEGCEKITFDNASSNSRKIYVAEFISPDEATFLKPEQINQRLPGECDNLCGEQKHPWEERNVSGVETEMVASLRAAGTGCYIANSAENVITSEQNCIVVEDSNDSKTRPSIGFNIDDTFDLTHSQIAMVEGDVSTAIYHKHLTNSKTNWIRIKQEQKRILRKLIDEVDELNKSIVQAANELKSQLYKPSPHHNTHYSSK